MQVDIPQTKYPEVIYLMYSKTNLIFSTKTNQQQQQQQQTTQKQIAQHEQLQPNVQIAQSNKFFAHLYTTTSMQLKKQTMAQFPSTEGASPGMQWCIEMVRKGTTSISQSADVLVRLLRHYNIGVNQVTLEHYLNWLSIQTCKSQSVAQYAKVIRMAAERIGLAWAQESIIPLMIKGLKASASPKEGANPMIPAVFHQIKSKLSMINQLALLIAILAGERLDETYRLSPEMVCVLNKQDLAPKYRNLRHQFVVFDTKADSKTGPTDPDALRFVDVVLLDPSEVRQLRQLMNRTRDGDPLFKDRSEVQRELAKHRLSDHSAKKGCGDILSVFIRDELLPETILPLVLKHSATENVPSVTAGYLSITGKSNILQAKQVFQAAVLLRRAICLDV